jgi:hypothetical protein
MVLVGLGLRVQAEPFVTREPLPISAVYIHWQSEFAHFRDDSGGVRACRNLCVEEARRRQKIEEKLPEPDPNEALYQAEPQPDIIFSMSDALSDTRNLLPSTVLSTFAYPLKNKSPFDFIPPPPSRIAPPPKKNLRKSASICG